MAGKIGQRHYKLEITCYVIRIGWKHGDLGGGSFSGLHPHFVKSYVENYTKIRRRDMG